MTLHDEFVDNNFRNVRPTGGYQWYALRSRKESVFSDTKQGVGGLNIRCGIVDVNIVLRWTSEK